MLNADAENRQPNLSARNCEQSKCSKVRVLTSKPATISGVSKNEAALIYLEYAKRTTKTLCNLSKTFELFDVYVIPR